MMVQITDFCDPNNQKKLEDFWMHKLRALYLEGLNIKRINQLLIINYCLVLMISENSCYILTCPVKLLSEKPVKRNVT